MGIGEVTRDGGLEGHKPDERAVETTTESSRGLPMSGMDMPRRSDSHSAGDVARDTALPRDRSLAGGVGVRGSGDTTAVFMPYSDPDMDIHAAVPEGYVSRNG